jgi:DNA modification methylase
VPVASKRVNDKIRTDLTLKRFIAEYQKSGRPIPVRFREILKDFAGSDRATHLIHPYPAKLLMQIPAFFLANNLLSRPGETVLDPFCGSGTVLLESFLMGRKALGFDVNPLARLIAQVKLTRIESSKLRRGIVQLKRRIPEKSRIRTPSVINVNYWFYPHVIRDLLRLLEAIKSTRDPDTRAFFLVCFSGCVRKVSLADPRLSVPVRLRRNQYRKEHWLHSKTENHLKRLKRVNIFSEFDKIVESNFKRVLCLENTAPQGVNAHVIGADARQLRFDASQNGRSNRKVSKESVDLIITSPPYCGAQKYIRASSLSLGWLELCATNELRKIESLTIGREHHRREQYQELIRTGLPSADRTLKKLRVSNPLRSHIAGTYLLEMRDAFREMARVLKPNRYMVLIAGNNRVCGKRFMTEHYLRKIAEAEGFTLVLRLVDDIRSRGLMTKRNKTASVITREWVLVFKKSVPNGTAS